MTQKHIITLVLLIVIMVPAIGYAEVYYLSAKSDGTPKIKNIPAADIERNKKEQILNALNALDQNINIVDKSIKQTLIRIKGVDSNNSKLQGVKKLVEDAEVKLSEAEKSVDKSRETLKTLSVNDKEQVMVVKEQIADSKKLTHESIALIRKAIQSLKKMKVSHTSAE